MKSLQRSWGKICRPLYIFIFASLVAGLVACQLPGRLSEGEAQVTSSTGQESSPAETSLSADQKAIADLRQNIPAEKRIENDQLKAILSLTGELKENPSAIRQKFSRQTQKMRELHRRQAQKSRDDFNKNEKRKREEFYRGLKHERDNIKKRQMSRDERKDFFDNQEQRRRDFSAEEKDKRNQFNADLKTKEDDFSSTMRDKNNEFNEQMRDYTTRYNDWQREKNKKPLKPTPQALPLAQPVEEAQSIEPQKAVPLKTKDEGP